VTLSRFHPGPGERSFQPSTITQPPHKDGREVADFLSRLALVYKVFELEGRDCPHAFLHPTFYSFGFTDSEGNSHVFEYRSRPAGTMTTPTGGWSRSSSGSSRPGV
jgi:hypothetical protein